ncbi:MAG: hypothetical protein V2I57_16190 [Xanthomonadales bacterium]|jgi:hypothetical protein|nr:hypothetical protein [Xanthomonadales bacterium]
MSYQSWKALSCLALGALVAVLPMAAPAQNQDLTQGQTQFSYSRDATAVVVQYLRTPGELEAEDPTTRLSVFGDGRVLVDFPAFSVRSGLHQTRLSEDELDSLVRDLVAARVMEFDPATLDSANPQASPASGSSGPFALGPMRTHTADADRVEFVIRLETYAPPGSPTAEDVEKRLVVHDLQGLRRQHPDIPAVTRLAVVERRFIALIEGDSLEPQP